MRNLYLGPTVFFCVALQANELFQRCHVAAWVIIFAFPLEASMPFGQSLLDVIFKE